MTGSLHETRPISEPVFVSRKTGRKRKGIRNVSQDAVAVRFVFDTSDDFRNNRHRRPDTVEVTVTTNGLIIRLEDDEGRYLVGEITDPEFTLDIKKITDTVNRIRRRISDTGAARAGKRWSQYHEKYPKSGVSYVFLRPTKTLSVTLTVTEFGVRLTDMTIRAGVRIPMKKGKRCGKCARKVFLKAENRLQKACNRYRIRVESHFSELRAVYEKLRTIIRNRLRQRLPRTDNTEKETTIPGLGHVKRGKFL